MDINLFSILAILFTFFVGFIGGYQLKPSIENKIIKRIEKRHYERRWGVSEMIKFINLNHKI